MKLSFHGAAQTVTGSRHLLSVNGRRLLLDCGLFQGRRSETYARNLEFDFDPAGVDAVVLSHAHLDHCGNLPNLVRHGFVGPIHTTAATADITELLLRDAARIQESDAAYLNKKHQKAGQPAVLPLYTAADAARVGERFRGQAYLRPFEPVPGAHVTLVDAGHILGSAGVVVDLEEKGRRLRLMFSGDIGRPGMPLLRDPQLPEGVDVLLMECTYGDRNHPSPAQAYEQLHAIVSDTIERGGKVIIPAFAVGRTQEIVYDLQRMVAAGELPRVPVFVDSPLAVNVTDIFRAHPECFDEETRAFVESGESREALGFEMLTYIRSVEESKALNQRKEPMIIISASGMLEVGRVLHHLEHNVHDENSVVLIVSWMAPHTLGRRLVEGETRIKIFGESYERKIRVAHIQGFSAHAGQDGLREYALATKETVRNIYLVHGEAGPAQALSSQLASEGFDRVHFPAWGSRVEL